MGNGNWVQFCGVASKDVGYFYLIILVSLSKRMICHFVSPTCLVFFSIVDCMRAAAYLVSLLNESKLEVLDVVVD